MSKEELQAELDERKCKLGELCFEWRRSGADLSIGKDGQSSFGRKAGRGNRRECICEPGCGVYTFS